MSLTSEVRPWDRERRSPPKWSWRLLPRWSSRAAAAAAQTHGRIGMTPTRSACARWIWAPCRTRFCEVRCGRSPRRESTKWRRSKGWIRWSTCSPPAAIGSRTQSRRPVRPSQAVQTSGPRPRTTPARKWHWVLIYWIWLIYSNKKFCLCFICSSMVLRTNIQKCRGGKSKCPH